ncbi:MAG TPA: serine hydrolase [Alphaproteobacteria bacterium]|nr:serine hydrolase [Alphaproteobacteria bacterium]
MHINKNLIIIILAVLLVSSIAVNFFIEKHYENKYKPKFSLISPEIAWLELGDFMEVQKQYSIEYQGLKTEMLAITENPTVDGTYGVYFEDLNTGAWIGLNEKDEFVPASLLKVPMMVAVLKKVESGDIKLEDKVIIQADDLNTNSGTLWMKGGGYEITLKELLVYMIKESDNTAVLTLHRYFLTDEDILEAKLAMGLPMGNHETYDSIGPKHYSNILRSLYYSAYLRRTLSELGLSIMSETDYNAQIPAGVPDHIPISHKIGFYYGTDGSAGYHDCGIIYYPNKPYILCVMSKGTDKEEADFVISRISQVTYEYVDKHFND